MAKITGKLIYAYPTQQIISKNTGNPFQKRDFVIAVQSFDRDTGEPTIDQDNTPMLTLTGDRCPQLDNIAQGQIVTVDFYLRGRRYRDDSNKERIITDVNVTSVRPAGAALPTAATTPKAPVPALSATAQAPQAAAAPATGENPSPAAPDNLPF